MATQTITRCRRYRKVPSLTDAQVGSRVSDQGKQGKCARLRGHILIVLEGRIECQSCGATWKDEGF